MKKSFRRSEYTIFYKNSITLGSSDSKSADYRVYEFKTVARSSREAVNALKGSREFSIHTNKGKTVKGFKKFSVVRVFTGDPLMFKNYRGKMERKYVEIIPTKCPKELR